MVKRDPIGTKHFHRTYVQRLKRLQLIVIAGVVIVGLGMTAATTTWATTPIPGLDLQKALPSWSEITSKDVATGKVMLDGYELFAIAAPALPSDDSRAEIAPIRERVNGIENTLQRIVNSDVDPKQLNVTTAVDGNSNLPVIYVDNQYLMTVTTLDAQLQVQQPERWAEQLTRIIRYALIRAHQERQPAFLQRQAIAATGILVAMLISSGLMAVWQRRLRDRRDQMQPEMPIAPVVHDTSTAAAADSTIAIATMQSQHRKRQRRDFQDLQRRLLKLGQIVIWVSGFIAMLGLFPYTRWLQPFVFATPLRILGILLGIYILIRVSDVLIDQFSGAFAQGKLLHSEGAQRLNLRVTTFSRVLKSGAAVLWIAVGLLVGLSMVGVNLLPLLAGAGIIGLAISFAAQSLVKDMINGFLILMEDQYAVGDVIIVGNVSGFVENMNLRITQLRNNEGQLITIPNSTISVVQNLSKDWSRVDLAIELAYGTNPDHALAVIRQLCEDLYHDPEWQAKMPEPPEVLGIDEIHHTGILIRVWLKTLPLQQWAIAREFRRRLTLTLKAEGLAVGVPQQSLWFKTSLDLDLDRANDDRVAHWQKADSSNL